MGVAVEGRPEAAAEVWRWGDAAPPAPEREPTSRARMRGVLQGLVGAGIGAALYHYWSPIVGTVVMTIGTVIALSALVSPGGLYAGIERLFLALGVLTGKALTWLLLVPLFYVFFLPFGSVMRTGRRDRLKRFLEPEADSYWEPHEGPTSGSAHHDRQF